MAITTTTITYGEAAGVALTADLYQPGEKGSAPIVICVHGGGWRGGSRPAYRFFGPLLAERGYVVMAIDYRLVPAHRYPAAVDDVRTAVAYARTHAADIGGNPDAIALMGDSAGAYLASLVGLTAGGIRAIVPVFGVYDLAAQWEHDLATRPNDRITEEFLGTALSDDRRIYFEASPLSYVTQANSHVAVLLAWGTLDDIVLPEQSERFLRALKQANFYVRTVVQAAPHYWIGDPLDEPGSYSGFFAARLLRFLAEKVPLGG